MKDCPGIEATLELSEVVLDQLSTSDLLADLPVVGTAFKICRSVGGIRDRFYIAKLQAFVFQLDAFSASDRHGKIAEILKDPSERFKVGESLLMILEQVSDRQRPETMAVFFTAYLRGMIDLPFLLRCWDSIAAAYSGDLAVLLGQDAVSPAVSGTLHLQHLLRTGLTQIRGITFAHDGTMQYDVSPFGEQFIKTFHTVSATRPGSETSAHT